MRSTTYTRIESTAEMIIHHIEKARNDAVTLEGICDHAENSRTTLLHYSHFFATIKTSLWGSMILNLNHCFDRNREALGFPCLLRLISKSFPEEAVLVNKLRRQFQALEETAEAKSVTQWRSEMLAHVAHDHNAYRNFLQNVPCCFRDINDLLDRCEKLLSDFKSAFPEISIGAVVDYHRQAKPSVDSVMGALHKAIT